jgi:outer membrane protein assembly factor BamD (BamD/ComL family)
LQALEQVHLNDIGGPLADKALFLAGGVKFYREDYKEADYYYSQIVEQHANSPLAPQAIELAILSKHMSTGGSDYDGRKVAEARNLIDTAMRSYPELANEKNLFLKKQMASINLQQAEKDYNTADFYLRTKHPGAAFYYFEIVRRTYPQTRFGEMAVERLAEIRRDVDAGKYSKAESDRVADLLNQWEGLFTKKGASPDTGPAPAPVKPGVITDPKGPPL